MHTRRSTDSGRRAATLRAYRPTPHRRYHLRPTNDAGLASLGQQLTSSADTGQTRCTRLQKWKFQHAPPGDARSALREEVCAKPCPAISRCQRLRTTARRPRVLLAHAPGSPPHNPRRRRQRPPGQDHRARAGAGLVLFRMGAACSSGISNQVKVMPEIVDTLMPEILRTQFYPPSAHHALDDGRAQTWIFGGRSERPLLCVPRARSQTRVRGQSVAAAPLAAPAG